MSAERFETSVINAFQARVIMRLSALIIAVLLPFLAFHLYRGHFAIAGLLGLIALAEGWLVWSIRRQAGTSIPVHMAAVLYTLGTLYVIHAMGTTGTYWVYPVILSNFYILPLRSALSLNLLAMLGGAALISHQPDIAVRLLSTTGIMIAFGVVFARQVSEQRRVLNDLSLIDPLTLAQNRRALDIKLARVAKSKSRHRSRISAIMLDIDRFKAINDRHDHHTGDDVLKAIVNLIKGRLRETDNLFRYGGEEFLILAEHTGLQEAKGLADDLRSRVMAQDIDQVGTVTVSAGVAELLDGELPLAWVSRADEALYRAKRTGRNRVCIDRAGSLKKPTPDA